MSRSYFSFSPALAYHRDSGIWFMTPTPPRPRLLLETGFKSKTTIVKMVMVELYFNLDRQNCIKMAHTS